MTIPYGRHFIDYKDIKSVVRVLKKKFITQGPQIEKFEKAVCRFTGAKYAVAVNSCTAGLHLAIKAICKKNYNIITSPVSFVSTSNSILFNNLKPIFTDIELDGLNLDVNKIVSIIQKKKISAIIPVHLGGVANNSEEIFKIAKKKKIFVIEDAAHSFGGTYKDGSKIGSCKFSDISVFSFHPVKTITTGEGGVITTNSKEVYEKLIILRNHGIQKNSVFFKNYKNSHTKNNINPWYYEMTDLGYNYRINDFQCALGISQLNKINKILNKRKKISIYYDKKLKKNKLITLFQSKFRKQSANHLYIIGINFKKLKINKYLLVKKLQEKGILTQVHYIPIPMHPYYQKLGYKMTNLENTKAYYHQAISIPIYFELSFKTIDKIIKILGDHIK